MVPTEGAEQARKVMLDIRNDPRVPMMEIFNLYRGRLDVEAVLDAAKRGNPTKDQLAGRMFYTNLYLGLYYQSQGEKELAKKYLQSAASEEAGKNSFINRYMWDVARIHMKTLSAAPAGTSQPN